MRVAPWANVAVLALLVASCLAVPNSAWGEEPEVQVSNFTIPLNGEVSQDSESNTLSLRLVEDPGPDVIMVTYGLDVISSETPTSSTESRTYLLICRERILELEKRPLVEFEFDINREEETPPQPNQVRKAFDSLINSLRKRPAASELIAEKIGDAIFQSRDAEQIKGFYLHMEVENGRVFLEGDVVSVEQQRHVKKIVKSIPEVRRLVYRVTVRQPEK